MELWLRASDEDGQSQSRVRFQVRYAPC